MTISEVIWSLLITSITGLIFGLFTIIYKSKCKHISCCGIVIDRDVEGEEKIDQQEVSHITHNLV